jgi:hypothetical protein
MINEFLDAVLNDFKVYVQYENDLCKLLDTHFDGGRIPDYSDINIQQLYLLRYAYAYAFEYKYMYNSLLRDLNISNKIEITSIGCGSMIDYWSLSRVVGSRYTISYNGVDAINWHYKFFKRPNDSLSFYCVDAIDYLCHNGISSDIYMFPKSISEFSIDEVNKISECFSANSISKDRIHFIFSLRTDQGSMARDTQKTKIIFKRLLNVGFRTSNKIDNYYHFKDDVKDKNIHNVDSDFRLPGSVIDYIKGLYSFCPQFNQCIKSADCRRKLGRYPMLKCKYAAWQIFSFERE